MSDPGLSDFVTCSLVMFQNVEAVPALEDDTLSVIAEENLCSNFWYLTFLLIEQLTSLYHLTYDKYDIDI